MKLEQKISDKRLICIKNIYSINKAYHDDETGVKRWSSS